MQKFNEFYFHTCVVLRFDNRQCWDFKYLFPRNTQNLKLCQRRYCEETVAQYQRKPICGEQQIQVKNYFKTMLKQLFSIKADLFQEDNRGMTPKKPNPIAG